MMIHRLQLLRSFTWVFFQIKKYLEDFSLLFFSIITMMRKMDDGIGRILFKKFRIFHFGK